MIPPGFLMLLGPAAQRDMPHLSGLALRHASPGVAVRATPDMPSIPFDDGEGLLLGTLFRSGSGAPVTRLASAECAEIRASGGSNLLERYWGSYVAIFHSPRGIAVLRDPSATLACYEAPVEGGVLLCSDAARAAASGYLHLRLDWDEVARHLAFLDAHPLATALAPLAELLPGEVLHVRENGLERDRLWTPAIPRPPSPPPDFENLAAALEHRLDAVLGCWARLFKRPLIELSGGLDSSIVAAGTARHNPEARCITLLGRAGDLDESDYARAVASRHGLGWQAASLRDRDVDIAWSAASHLPRPVARSFAQAGDALCREASERQGCDGYLTGAGGDNVFWYLASSLPVLDRLAAEGPLAAWQSVRDIARIAGVPRRAVTGDLWRRLRMPGLGVGWPRTPLFLTPSTATAGPPEHPWLEACAGKCAPRVPYVRALLQIQNHLEAHPRRAYAPLIAPLLAQPVVAFCLATPAWLWSRAGQDRALVRAACRDWLPEAILARRSKGGFDGFVTAIAANRRGELAERLGDGLLASKGLIDAFAVRDALSGDHPVSGANAIRLLALADIEAWARVWHDRGPAR